MAGAPHVPAGADSVTGTGAANVISGAGGTY